MTFFSFFSFFQTYIRRNKIFFHFIKQEKTPLQLVAPAMTDVQAVLVVSLHLYMIIGAAYLQACSSLSSSCIADSVANSETSVVFSHNVSLNDLYENEYLYYQVEGGDCVLVLGSSIDILCKLYGDGEDARKNKEEECGVIVRPKRMDGGDAGIQVRICLQHHPRFLPDMVMPSTGDIYATLNVSFLDYLYGKTFELEHIDGSLISVPFNARQQKVVRIPNRGFLLHTELNSHRRGMLLVGFNVVLPVVDPVRIEKPLVKFLLQTLFACPDIRSNELIHVI
jgi:hypothetical protein